MTEINIDLNDRSIADMSQRTKFFPRAAYDARVKLLAFGPFESGTGMGFEATFEVNEATATKENLLFEPLPAVGTKCVFRFLTRIAPKPWITEQARKQLRLFAVACDGKEHTPEADANGPIKTLLALGASNQLHLVPEIIFSRDAWTKDGTDKEGKAVTYVNNADEFRCVKATA